MVNEKQKEGFEKFQERCLELANGDTEKVELAKQLAELELDFEFVKDLNTQLANKYAELLDCFPTSEEISKLLELSKDEDRTIKLSKFRSAVVCLEKNDPLAKPVRYDDLIKNEGVN